MALTQIDDRGLKTPIDLIDNEKIRLGTGNDLELYHDGSNSYIKDTGTGNLYIFSENLRIENADGSESYIEANANGAVELYYNGSKKLETTSAGVDVTGVMQCDEFKLLDGEHAKFGTGEDLRIYHTGSLSYIQDTGTGHLVLSGTKVQMTNAADSEGMFMATEDGSVDLYYDGTKKLETTSAGIAVTGDIHPTGHIFMDSGYGVAFDPYGGSGVNLLDDYEEGTWTPTATAGTFTTGTGTYTKIGRLVTAFFVIEVHSTTSGNYMQFNGLPFTNAGNVGENISSISYNETGNVMRIYVNDGVAGLFWNDSTSFFTYANCSGDRIRGGVSYFAAT